MLKKDRILRIFELFQAHNPNPEGELYYTNPYTLLVAVTLSAQATDKQVNKATTPLFDIISTPHDMVELGEEKLRDYIKSIGLYKTKAHNVMLMATQLIEHHAGLVPQNREDLQKLAGVGRKTANVVLNIAFQQHTIAVDTHLFRLSNRLKIAEGKTVLAVEQKLLKNIPKQYLYNAHHWLILHGRYICKAQKPACHTCFLTEYCPAFKKHKT